MAIPKAILAFGVRALSKVLPRSLVKAHVGANWAEAKG